MTVSLAEQIRAALRQGETLRGLTRKAGLHRNTLNAYRRESWTPQPATLRKLSPYLPDAETTKQVLSTEPERWQDRVLIDDRDRPLLEKYRLKRTDRRRRIVAVERTTGRSFVFARIIMDAPAGMVVDHINGDPFDNRRVNLRLCSIAENVRNRFSHRTGHAFKGVFEQANGKWVAHCGLHGKVHHIGTFDTAEDAARAYDTKARELHGEFAALNFPLDGERGCLRTSEAPV